RRRPRSGSRLGAEAVRAAGVARPRLLFLGVSGNIGAAHHRHAHAAVLRGGAGRDRRRRSGGELPALHHPRDPRVRIARADLQFRHRRRRTIDWRAAPARPRPVPRRRAAAVVGVERRCGGGMAAGGRGRGVSGRGPALIAVDSVSNTAMKTAAREALASLDRRRRSGISHWDASGLFEELAIADEHAGRPSARTLLLLYAADLAFRLRWEIKPALAAGRGVVAAPYVDTAIAFGRAAGLRGGWLKNLFRFAPAPSDRWFVEPARG